MRTRPTSKTSMTRPTQQIWLPGQAAKHMNMIFTRRLKGVKLVNPIALMGNTGEEALALWANEPVHPSDLAYQKMARTISDDINCPPMAASRPSNSETPRSENRSSTAAPRKSWTSHTQQVASRRGRWSEHHRSSGHSFRSRGHKLSLHKRGGRGGGGRGCRCRGGHRTF